MFELFLDEENDDFHLRQKERHKTYVQIFR